MDEIDSKRVRGGLGYFKIGYAEEPPILTPLQEGFPPFTEYEPNYQIGISISEISIGLGFKTFSYNSEEPKLFYGDLVLITPYFGNETVEGEMRGMLHTRSYNPTTGVSTIVVEVYYSDMRVLTIPFINSWKIAFQLNDGSNIVQNPDSPYLAKLSVWDGHPVTNGFARLFVPGRVNLEQETIIDTPEETFTESIYTLYGNVQIREDMSDIHKPWLGTTQISTCVFKKRTRTQTWTYDPDDWYAPPVYVETITFDDEPREYSHKFTTFDFDPMSPDFQPAPEGEHSPSFQNTEKIVDTFEGYFQTLYIQREVPPELQPPEFVWTKVFEQGVTWNLEGSQRITDVTPPSFFEPPFAP